MKGNKNKTKQGKKQLNGSQNANDKKRFFIDTIAKFCDKCGTAYTPRDVHIVQESNFSSIIHFSCSNCKSNQIATFIRPMGMSSRVPVNCDLMVGEISEFAKNDKVSTDEVLTVFTELEKSTDHVII